VDVAETEITCKELVELVSDYIERKLPRRERRRFDRHLARCPWCTMYVEQMRQVVGSLGRLTEASLSPAARAELLGAFHDWKQA
jgi:anti-sigma factor RsiW